MLVLYSAFTAINTAVEILGYITSLVRLLFRLKVPPPVCFGLKYFAAKISVFISF